MGAVRRWYIYLVCVVSLQMVAWALITLLRSLLVSGIGLPRERIALQLALIIIGLPIYLVHWLWAQRLARRDPEERASVVRCLYLYGIMASFLGAWLPNAYGLLGDLLRLALGMTPAGTARAARSLGNSIIQALVAIAVLGLLWLYHWHVARVDRQAIPERGDTASIRALYLLGFCGAGLAVASLAVITLLRWLLFEVDSLSLGAADAGIPRAAARLVVGVAVWLIFWRLARREIVRPDETEGVSVLGKVYQYGVIFIAVLSVATGAWFALTSLFERALGSTSSGLWPHISRSLSVMLPMGLVWAYHAWVLYRDAAAAGEPRSQALVRQPYRYLVAGVGLAAVLVGVAGLVSVLIRSLSAAAWVVRDAEPVASYGAALLAGLPVWLIPWWQLQKAAAVPGPAGDDESRSLARRIYLYFFLAAATITVLWAGVLIVSKLVGRLLGVSRGGDLLASLGQAIAYSLIAVGVWLYHGSLLRRDARRAEGLEAERLATLHVAVVDGGDGFLGRRLVDALRAELKGLQVEPLGLTPEAAAALGGVVQAADVPALLAQADVIVGPWTMAAAGGAADDVARAIVASPAHKVLVPAAGAGFHWAGLDRLDASDAVRQAVRAVRQIIAGKEAKARRPLGTGAITGIVIGVVLLLALAIAALELTTGLFY